MRGMRLDPTCCEEAATIPGMSSQSVCVCVCLCVCVCVCVLVGCEGPWAWQRFFDSINDVSRVVLCVCSCVRACLLWCVFMCVYVCGHVCFGVCTDVDQQQSQDSLS